ncbi:MAG: hypothetical protein JRG91_11665 [Deltaproteobacteria bacterium]|nr:hypothetical protein [Deltaproteobacteria bacterium]
MRDGKSFSTDLRVLICRLCGAPLTASREGGETTCDYCGAVSVLSRCRDERVRITDPTLQGEPDPEKRERLRMASLERQMETYDEEKNPYAYYGTPSGLEHLDLEYMDPTLPAIASEAFRKAIADCEESGGELNDQRLVFWIALKLKNMWVIRDRPHDARPVIETASEVLTDPGYRQLMFCKMADLARKADDLEAARAWLARCDPRPPLLDLDSDYRTTAAAIAIRQGKWSRVLELVGRERGDVPFEPSSVALLQLQRVEALENLGEGEAAERELGWLLDALDHDFLARWLDGSKMLASCKSVWDRIERGGRVSTSNMEHRDAPGASGPAPDRRMAVYVVIGILVVLCIAAAAYLLT